MEKRMLLKSKKKRQEEAAAAAERANPIEKRLMEKYPINPPRDEAVRRAHRIAEQLRERGIKFSRAMVWQILIQDEAFAETPKGTFYEWLNGEDIEYFGRDLIDDKLMKELSLGEGDKSPSPAKEVIVHRVEYILQLQKETTGQRCSLTDAIKILMRCHDISVKQRRLETICEPYASDWRLRGLCG